MTIWETLLSNLYGSTSLTPAKRGRDSLRIYQHKTIDIIKSIWAEDGPPGVIVALEPGAGKTVSTLTAISDLLAEGKIKRVLLVAPLLVAETVWDAEIEEWEHLTGLRCSKLLGDPKARSAAFEDDAPLHIINRENIPWLWDHAKDRWPYDCLVIDEASMLKNGKKRTPNRKLSRFGALAQARKHFTGVVELTGTPAPNGVQNLWGLAYIIDQGERLCKTQSAFDQRWMNFNKYTFERKAKPGAEEDIMSRIKDIMVSLDPADYSQLPPLVENNIRVTLPPKVMEEYHKFKKTLVYDPLDVEAVNAAVLTNKLLQACNGSIFDEDGKHHHIHDCKLDALVDLHAECGGIPLLVAYTYKFDLDRIKSKFPNALVLNQQKDVMKTVRDWNEGKIDMLLAHPACLHPDTEVLTEHDGWRRIVDVKDTDRVFDGVEYVNHKGCRYSGYKEVIEVFGIVMTPDHKILIDGEWVEASNVGTDPSVREKARYAHKGDACCGGSLHEVWGGGGDSGTELQETQSTRTHSLQELRQRQFPQHDRNSYLQRLVRNEIQDAGQEGQELWGQGNLHLGGLAEVRELLSGYGENLQQRSHNRTLGCEQGIFQGELCLGDEHGATSQQTKQPHSLIQRGADALGRSVQSNGCQQDQADTSNEQGNDPRGSGERCQKIDLRDGHNSQRIATEENPSTGTTASKTRSHVYDLVDCGPRSRFLVRNQEGEMFISHNSAGHGLNLQKGSNISVWYGLTADLELFQQFNKRLWRSGQQAKVVFSHRIIAAGTHDEEILPILDSKDAVQSRILRATQVSLSQ